MVHALGKTAARAHLLWISSDWVWCTRCGRYANRVPRKLRTTRAAKVGWCGHRALQRRRRADMAGTRRRGEMADPCQDALATRRSSCGSRRRPLMHGSMHATAEQYHLYRRRVQSDMSKSHDRYVTHAHPAKQRRRTATYARFRLHSRRVQATCPSLTGYLTHAHPAKQRRRTATAMRRRGTVVPLRYLRSVSSSAKQTSMTADAGAWRTAEAVR